MKSVRRALAYAALLGGAVVTVAAPAEAMYTVQWSNGGTSYVCDNGNVYDSVGDTSGTYWISGWYWGQGPC